MIISAVISICLYAFFLGGERTPDKPEKKKDCPPTSNSQFSHSFKVISYMASYLPTKARWNYVFVY